MRCEVLVAKDSSLGTSSHFPVTSVELYNEATALAAARREVEKSQMKSKAFNLPPSLREKLNDILAATGHKIEAPLQKEKIHKRKRNLCNEKGRKDGSLNNKNESKLGDENLSEEESTASCETLADRKQVKNK